MKKATAFLLALLMLAAVSLPSYAEEDRPLIVGSASITGDALLCEFVYGNGLDVGIIEKDREAYLYFTANEFNFENVCLSKLLTEKFAPDGYSAEIEGEKIPYGEYETSVVFGNVTFIGDSFYITGRFTYTAEGDGESPFSEYYYTNITFMLSTKDCKAFEYCDMPDLPLASSYDGYINNYGLRNVPILASYKDKTVLAADGGEMTYTTSGKKQCVYYVSDNMTDWEEHSFEMDTFGEFFYDLQYADENGLVLNIIYLTEFFTVMPNYVVKSVFTDDLENYTTVQVEGEITRFARMYNGDDTPVYVVRDTRYPSYEEETEFRLTLYYYFGSDIANITKYASIADGMLEYCLADVRFPKLRVFVTGEGGKYLLYHCNDIADEEIQIYETDLHAENMKTVFSRHNSDSEFILYAKSDDEDELVFSADGFLTYDSIPLGASYNTAVNLSNGNILLLNSDACAIIFNKESMASTLLSESEIDYDAAHSSSVVIASGAAKEDVDCVCVNGVELPKSCYTVDDCDNASVTLANEYLFTLESGSYTIELNTVCGSVKATLTLTNDIPFDVDGDGKMDVKDYCLIKRAVLGSASLTATQLSVADIDGDGVITAVDYVLMKRIYLGSYRK